MITKLEATNNLGGLLIYENSAPTPYSPADSVKGFNEIGNGFNFKQFSYPVVMITKDDDLNKILSYAGKNRKAVDSTLLLPTYKAQFRYYMGPTKDVTSNKCLLWKDLFGDIRPQCQPLGGLSVWATTEPIDASAAAAKNIVMATSGMDGASLFHDLVPGADAPASSVVAILAAADAVGNWKRRSAASAAALKQIIGYSLFQGEAWDSIGSRRFVYDIARYQADSSCNNSVAASESPTGRKMCLSPLRPSEAFRSFGGNLERLSAVVAVDQVGRGTGTFVHTDAADGVPPGTTKADMTNGMPPSPVDSFRLRKPSIPGYVLGGYNKNFSNNFYHSQFDNFTTAAEMDSAVVRITEAATQLSKTLIWLASDKDAGVDTSALAVNTTMVRDLLTCIIGDWKCQMFHDYLASTYANLEKYLNVEQLRFSSVSPVTNARQPSLYASVASISQIPPTLPYVTLTVQDIPNYVFELPKCAKGALDTPDKELCMLCNEDDCNLKSKEALMQNIHVVTFPENVYEAFLRSFLVEKTSNNITRVACNNTADCRANKFVDDDFECHSKKCILPSAYYHSAISPAIEPTANGEIYDVDTKLCEGPYGWICPGGKEMLWTEPNWSADIGVTIYPDGGNSIAWIALFFGVVVFASGLAAARAALAGLQKQKLL